MCVKDRYRSLFVFRVIAPGAMMLSTGNLRSGQGLAFARATHGQRTLSRLDLPGGQIGWDAAELDLTLAAVRFVCDP